MPSLEAVIAAALLLSAPEAPLSDPPEDAADRAVTTHKLAWAGTILGSIGVAVGVGLFVNGIVIWSEDLGTSIGSGIGAAFGVAAGAEPEPPPEPRDSGPWIYGGLILANVAGAAMVVGIVNLALGADGDPEVKPQVALSPLFLPGGGGGTFSVHF